MGTSGAQAAGIAGTTVGTGGTGDLSIAKGGGKTPIQKALNSVIQVDANKIVGNYITGAQEYDRHARESISYYESAIAAARKDIQTGYREGNIALAPLSKAGQQALNEQMRMLGMDAISPSVDYYKRLDPLASIDPSIEGLKMQLQEAEKLTSAEDRSLAKSKIMAKLENRMGGGVDEWKKQAIADLDNPGTRREYLQNAMNKAYDSVQQRYADDPEQQAFFGDSRSAMLESDNALNSYTAASDEYAKKKAEYDAKVEEINSQADLIREGLSSLRSDYNSNYSGESTAGYTGEQVAEKLASTPGYQAQLDMGTQALTRAAAATGELQSGKTGAALVEYGQSLAMNTYNNYMTNLSNIANTGSQATGQLAANYINEGSALGQLSTMKGQYGAQSITGIGQAYNQAYTNVAAAKERIAMFNAQMQYNSKQANLNRRSNSAMGALNAAPGMMNAAANMQQVQAGIYNQGQMAQGFMGAQATPLQQFSGYWGSPQVGSNGYVSGWSL